MKNNWLITFRSVTFAQKGERVLQKAGIDCTLQRTPKELSKQGCGYCLRVRAKDVMNAVELLRENQVSYGKTYALKDDGRPEERVL
ncbi:MAG: DUF3343 domain-containing protein [Oscillospiraceae bacterium]|nr:DUF3343 domain-containing protein [Oscillospiraceae bacterium]